MIVEKITEFIITRGDLHTVLWFLIAIVLVIIYALVSDKSILCLMISAGITCVASFSMMSLAAQLVTFLAIYLGVYLGLKLGRKKVTDKKE